MVGVVSVAFDERNPVNAMLPESFEHLRPYLNFFKRLGNGLSHEAGEQSAGEEWQFRFHVWCHFHVWFFVRIPTIF